MYYSCRTKLRQPQSALQGEVRNTGFRTRTILIAVILLPHFKLGMVAVPQWDLEGQHG